MVGLLIPLLMPYAFRSAQCAAAPMLERMGRSVNSPACLRRAAIARQRPQSDGAGRLRTKRLGAEEAELVAQPQSQEVPAPDEESRQRKSEIDPKRAERNLWRRVGFRGALGQQSDGWPSLVGPSRELGPQIWSRTAATECQL